MVKFSLQKVLKFAKRLFIKKKYTGFIKFYDMEPYTLIFALDEFIIIYYKIILIIDIITRKMVPIMGRASS